jgi:hypothetical protein
VSVDAAVVSFDEGFGDREADTGSAVFTVAGGVGSIEAVEQPSQVFVGDSVAGVDNRDHDLVIL